MEIDLSCVLYGATMGTPYSIPCEPPVRSRDGVLLMKRGEVPGQSLSCSRRKAVLPNCALLRDNADTVRDMSCFPHRA